MDNTEQNQSPVTAPVISAPATAPAKQEEKTSFSLEYVQELRAESAKYRTSAKDAVKAAEDAAALAAKVQADADAKIAEAVTKADQRIIRAELKAEAIKAGMVDLDGLKLADMSQLKLDENGEVIGAGELMSALKESKPYLFKSPVETTTNPAKPPVKEEAKKFDARTATDAERAAEARRLGINIKSH